MHPRSAKVVELVEPPLTQEDRLKVIIEAEESPSKVPVDDM